MACALAKANSAEADVNAQSLTISSNDLVTGIDVSICSLAKDQAQVTNTRVRNFSTRRQRQ